METNDSFSAKSSSSVDIVERELSYTIVVEVKSTDKLSDIPKRQLRNYVTALDLKLGLLLDLGPRAEYVRVFGRRTSAS